MVYTHPQVFFDITIGGRDPGRIVFQLFADTTPKVNMTFSLKFPLFSSPHPYRRFHPFIILQINRHVRTFVLCALVKWAWDLLANHSTTVVAISTELYLMYVYQSV